MAAPEAITRWGLDFYIKWIATGVALLHVILVSHDVAPWYKFTGILAAALWTWLGFLWRQPSIWILNIVMVMIYLKGMFGI
jgi:hypothetical protein